MIAIRRAAAVTSKCTFVAPTQVLGFSTFKDKEKAVEAIYFNKQDEKTLRKLLQKMKGQTDVTDKEGSKNHLEHDMKGLKEIPGLKLNDEQVQALLKWKHQH
ncbi:uncharacterized protein PHALS_02282 [Plasmopara halstedii]|uniref:Uncharacterized protein n=1 Tax=Plasmopara halstedii TaxID=4781 RepID=A0A0P1AXX2_PLAHL|nr:uncharacterized protein PHALS_02282 [Plasmopara halstedii]CEG45950.1 hypothetical protein PHALS_02282 [Plasmopara halstedii]|eukprot:XP_024582319.1 hypothetical protein PHALS_02282 [Plasmopara halstedii]